MPLLPSMVSGDGNPSCSTGAGARHYVKDAVHQMQGCPENIMHHYENGIVHVFLIGQETFRSQAGDFPLLPAMTMLNHQL